MVNAMPDSDAERQRLLAEGERVLERVRALRLGVRASGDALDDALLRCEHALAAVNGELAQAGEPDQAAGFRVASKLAAEMMLTALAYDQHVRALEAGQGLVIAGSGRGGGWWMHSRGASWRRCSPCCSGPRSGRTSTTSAGGPSEG